MESKASKAFSALILALALLSPAAVAQEDPAAAPEREGFWKRLPLYLEATAGQATGDDISTNLETTELQFSLGTVAFDEQDHTRLVIGWTLPEGKGGFRLAFTGIRETAFTTDVKGMRAQAANTATLADPDPSSTVSLGHAVKWWDLTIESGRLRSQSQQPEWSLAADANGNGIADPGEISFTGTAFGHERTATETLDNQIQTVELLFEREFGGRRYNGRWGGGVRYFTYEGNIPMAGWLATAAKKVVNTPPEPNFHGGFQGFTDGQALSLLTFSQETSGLGPTGFAEFRISFLRERFALYWRGTAAFVLQDLETDSGNFFTMVVNTAGDLVPLNARLAEDRGKDSWQPGLETGLRVRLASGLLLNLGYFLSSYQDAVLVPKSITIPTSPGSLNTTTALYTTRDLRLDGWKAGFSFQF